jgi:hypothetical protein
VIGCALWNALNKNATADAGTRVSPRFAIALAEKPFEFDCSGASRSCPRFALGIAMSGEHRKLKPRLRLTPERGRIVAINARNVPRVRAAENTSLRVTRWRGWKQNRMCQIRLPPWHKEQI